MNEKTPASETSKKSALWLSIVSIPTILLTIYLLAVGEKGTSIATVLAVPIGIFAIVIPFILSTIPPGMSTRHLLMVVVAVLLAGVLVPGTIWWAVNRYSDLEVDFGEPLELGGQELRTVQARIAKDDWRGHLVFTPILVSNDPLNDCVLTSSLRITPTINGLKDRQFYEGRHRQPVRIPIPPHVREVKLVIEYVPDNKDCVVAVSLSEGTLQR